MALTSRAVQSHQRIRQSPDHYSISKHNFCLQYPFSLPPDRKDALQSLFSVSCYFNLFSICTLFTKAYFFGPPTTLEKLGSCLGKCFSPKDDYPRHDAEYHNERYDHHNKAREKSSKYWINGHFHQKRMDHHQKQIGKIADLEVQGAVRAVGGGGGGGSFPIIKH